MKSKKKGVEPIPSRNGLTFESAIQRLEKIVADMEEAELPLEDVLKKYEEGTRLVQFCSRKLDEAEKKIEILTKKTDGSIALEPFEGERGESDEKESADESGKLF
jgi:exodeoxyribonuclease VII small subunit